MIDYHNIVETGDEKEIYLYVTFDYEFGPDFKEINKKMKSFNKNIIKYIKEKEINISNGKIFIVVGGVIFSTLILSNNQIVNTPKLLEGNKQIVEQIKTPVEKTEQEVFIKPKEEIKKTEEVIPKDEKKIVEKPKETVKPAIKKEVTKPKQSPTPTIINPITVHRSSGQVITLSLEEYVIGVVSSEMPASFNAEAL